MFWILWFLAYSISLGMFVTMVLDTDFKGMGIVGQVLGILVFISAGRWLKARLFGRTDRER
jgi:choline-glycine betaine transporter